MKFRDLKIGTKITLLFLLYGLLIPLIGGNLVYYTAKNLLTREIYAHLETTVTAGNDYIQFFLQQPNKRAEIKALLASGQQSPELNKIFSNHVGLGKTGEIYLINKDLLMITPSRFKEDVFLKQKVDTLNSRNVFAMRENPTKHIGHKSIGFFPDYRGVSALGTHVYLPEMEWGLLAEIDVQEAFAPLRTLQRIMFPLMFMIPFMALLIGWYFSRLITKPIARLKNVAIAMGQGNLDAKVIVESKDEVGERSLVFNQMTKNLKTITISREWFSTVLKSIGDAVISTDTKSCVTFMNAVAEDMTGWKQKEALGRPLAEVFNIINENTREKCANIVDKAVRTKKIVGLANHTVLIAKDKTERAIADSAAPIHDQKNDIIGVILVFRNVTEA